MSLPPYNEAYSTEFGLLADKAYGDAGRTADGGQCIFSMRAAFDYYTGKLLWHTSRDKHINELRQAQGLPPESVVPTSLPELRIRGQFFEQEGGTRWTGIQCTDFGLLAQHQNGLDITGVLAQRQACGFNLVRVFTSFENIPNIGTFTTINYDRVPEFVALCATYGLYVEFVAYTGVNNAYHWPHLVDAAERCYPKPLLELVNELDVNTDEPDSQGRVFRLENHHRPTTVLCSHGSNGSQAQPVGPYWDYVTFHTNGALEEQRKAGHNAMEIWEGPSLTNETSRYPEVGMWLSGDVSRQINLAYDTAEGAALLCAGSCFHSVSGKASQLWNGNEEAVARAWAAGAHSVPLHYQDGDYNHPIHLEGPDDLRVYQRVLPGGDAWTVYIKK